MLIAVVASVNHHRARAEQEQPVESAGEENSVIVSAAYLKQHELSVQAETNFMASDVANAKSVFDQDIDRFRQGFSTQAPLRGMPVAMMLRSDQSIILEAGIRLSPEAQEPPLPPVERLTQIGDAEAVADMLRDTNYSSALVKLKRDDDTYLFVARFIDPRVLDTANNSTVSAITAYISAEASCTPMRLASRLA